MGTHLVSISVKPDDILRAKARPHSIHYFGMLHCAQNTLLQALVLGKSVQVICCYLFFSVIKFYLGLLNIDCMNIVYYEGIVVLDVITVIVRSGCVQWCGQCEKM